MSKTALTMLEDAGLEHATVWLTKMLRTTTKASQRELNKRMDMFLDQHYNSWHRTHMHNQAFMKLWNAMRAGCEE